MTTITPISNQGNVNFRGIGQTENGIPYHKSNTGLITGSIIGGLGALSHLGDGFISDIAQKTTNSSGSVMQEELSKVLEKQKKNSIPFALIAAAMSIGCGAIVDHVRNKKAADTAEVVASTTNLNEAFMMDENLQANKYGLPYHHSNTGTKLGPLLGAVCGIVHGAMATANIKSSTFKLIKMLSDSAMMALAGWGVGALYDKIVNGKAEDASIKLYGKFPQL